MDFQAKMSEAVAMIEKVGTEYAEARALSWLLQEQRKVVLAKCTNEAAGKSIAEKENYARTSEEYKLHLEGTKEAIGEEYRLKAVYERWQAQYESIRSLLSLEKQKMQMV